jgi:hypothetical protein
MNQESDGDGCIFELDLFTRLERGLVFETAPIIESPERYTKGDDPYDMVNASFALARRRAFFPERMIVLTLSTMWMPFWVLVNIRTCVGLILGTRMHLCFGYGSKLGTKGGGRGPTHPRKPLGDHTEVDVWCYQSSESYAITLPS